MKNLKIHNSKTGRKDSIDKMLSLMTYEWVHSGVEIDTIEDMRDALIELIDWKKRVETAANEVIESYSSCDGMVEHESLKRLEKELEK